MKHTFKIFVGAFLISFSQGHLLRDSLFGGLALIVGVILLIEEWGKQ